MRVPGKVNLYLAVGDRRDDGYHELTTIFHAVSLLDEITVRNADVLSLELAGEGAETLPADSATWRGRPRSCWPTMSDGPRTWRSSWRSRSRWQVGWPAGAPTRRRCWWR